jgi:alkylation response protein AidB-like acyl-CoA dehydrogenase
MAGTGSTVTVTRPPHLAALADVVGRVEERAVAVDRGELDVRTSLAELGRAGLLGLGCTHGTLADQAEVVRSLARVCTATAFSVWAHRTATGYLARWGSEVARDDLLPALHRGDRPAATAMATAFQAALGLKELTVTAGGRDAALVLDGVIPWASNLFPGGAVVILPARTQDGRHVVVAITTDQDGVELSPPPPLLALGATASTTVRLTGVEVAPERVLTDRFLDFLADVRPSFLLLQTALCLGLADAALAAAAPRHTGTAVTFQPDLDRLAARQRELGARHDARLADPGRPVDDDLVRLRLDASELAVAATRHEAAVTGGAGYLASSATARRLREAAFLPIQSPTEVQLRWELSRSV